MDHFSRPQASWGGLCPDAEADPEPESTHLVRSAEHVSPLVLRHRECRGKLLQPDILNIKCQLKNLAMSEVSVRSQGEKWNDNLEHERFGMTPTGPQRQSKHKEHQTYQIKVFPGKILSVTAVTYHSWCQSTCTSPASSFPFGVAAAESRPTPTDEAERLLPDRLPTQQHAPAALKPQNRHIK